MSQENVEAFREGIDAFNRRDIDGILRVMDPGVRFEHRLADLQGSFVGTKRSGAGSRTSSITSRAAASTARTSAIWAIACSRWARCMAREGEAVSKSRFPTRSSRVSRTAW